MAENKRILNGENDFPNSKGDYYLVKKRLLEFVKKDLENHSVEKAITRLEGFLQRHTTDQMIHNLLGELFLLIGKELKAGRHLYLKEAKTQTERIAVESFEKSLGYDPILIAKKLINKNYFQPSCLNYFSKKKYAELIAQSKAKIGKTPKFLLGLERYLVKWERRKL